MPTAYVSFCRPINWDTSSTLLTFCRSALFDRDKDGKRLGPYDKLRLMLTSAGGTVAAAFAAYNEIKSMPIEVHTINTGAVDSSAIMIFMTGKKRYACQASAFLFHQMSWTFSGKDDLPVLVLSDAVRWLNTYQGMMAGIISASTNLSRENVLEMMQVGTTLTAQESLERGLIHEIVEPAVPADARWWQV
jgi:ATP-dependent protease ClpP protease subunit